MLWHGWNASRSRNTKSILLPYCVPQSVINQPFLFTDMSCTDKNSKGISASQPARPSWAVSVDNNETWELMNIDLPPPLPQRKSHRKQQPSSNNNKNNDSRTLNNRDNINTSDQNISHLLVPVNSKNTTTNIVTTSANNSITTSANNTVINNTITTSTHIPITSTNTNSNTPATSYGSSLNSIISSFHCYLVNRVKRPVLILVTPKMFWCMSSLKLIKSNHRYYDNGETFLRCTCNDYSL